MIPPAVAALLAEPGAELHETHSAWVVLHADRALKVKKPVRFSFLDYTTVEARRDACREEVRLNRELAPGLYLGVRELDGEPAVEMRRFDEHATMAALLGSGRLHEAQVAEVAVRLAAFHAHAPRCAAAAASDDWRRRASADIADVVHHGGDGSEPGRRFLDAALRRLAPVLDGRGHAGLVREGHGDLRAEHVLLTTPLTIVDRLEFDRALRCADIADDLAFLAMDLEWLGARWAAELLLAAYADAGGTPAPPPLAALFAWRRALVRAKVALIGQRPEQAAALLQFAGRLAWRARPSVTLAVVGPPASGKTTLARALGERLEVPVVASDVVRKQLAGVAPTERLEDASYSAAATEASYRALIERARAEERPDGGVIVDATFSTVAQRTALGEALAGPVRWIRCTVPAEELERRARQRAHDAARISDAGPEVAVALAERFEPLDDLAGVLDVDTRAPLDAQVGAVAAWLDDCSAPIRTDS